MKNSGCSQKIFQKWRNLRKNALWKQKEIRGGVCVCLQILTGVVWEKAASTLEKEGFVKPFYCCGRGRGLFGFFFFWLTRGSSSGQAFKAAFLHTQHAGSMDRGCSHRELCLDPWDVQICTNLRCECPAPAPHVSMCTLGCILCIWPVAIHTTL